MQSFIKYILKKFDHPQLSVFIGYVRGSGWMKSILAKKPIDANGNPLPWYTYCFIHFLETRLLKEQEKVGRLFEFGSGNSTLWWAQRASQVVSVEDNEDWYSYVTKSKPDHVSYKFAADQQSYLDALLLEEGLFDVIVVDGSFRDICIERCSVKLSAKGVVIIDNSDWENLQRPIEVLKSQGFRQLEFYGIGPTNGHPWGTSIFYRADNFLGL